MEMVDSWCTPTANVFEGLHKSGDGRTTPNKLSWQAHHFISQYRSAIPGEVLSPAFSGWLMGFPAGWADTDTGISFSVSYSCL